MDIPENLRVFPSVNIPVFEGKDSTEATPETIFTAVAGTLSEKVVAEISEYSLKCSCNNRAITMNLTPGRGGSEKDTGFYNYLRVDFDDDTRAGWDLPLPIRWDTKSRIWGLVEQPEAEVEVEEEPEKIPSVGKLLHEIAGRCVYFIESALDKDFEYKQVERDTYFTLLSYFKTLPVGIDKSTGFAKLFLITCEAASKMGMTNKDINDGLNLILTFQMNAQANANNTGLDN